MTHVPVFLDEICAYLRARPGKTFIDATANGGGHLFALADCVGRTGKILGIEIDPHVFRALETKVHTRAYPQITLVEDSYTNIAHHARTLGNIDGVIFDLGMSSLQIESSGRGFSFLGSEPLDMRFNLKQALRARDIINHCTKDELATIFTSYGEERYAKRIAEAVCEERKKKPIIQTDELTAVIHHALPPRARTGRIHYATRVFQALRMAVNNEYGAIQEGVRNAIDIISPGGRIAVISFHSIEDRLVKTILNEYERKKIVAVITKKPVMPSKKEISENPRARSAKLRVAEKK